MKRTTFLGSPEFGWIRGHVLVTVTAWGALMLVAMKVQFNSKAWAEDSAPVTIQTEKDRTPAVQNEFFAELLKRAAAGISASEKIGHRDMVERPAEVRGKGVHWEGILFDDVRRQPIEPLPLASGEMPPDVSKAVQTIVLDKTSGKTVAVTFLEPGPKPPHSGTIAFDGAFWKIVTYTNQRGDVVPSPYLVAKTWTVVAEETSSPVLPALMGLTGGIAIASVVIGAGASRRKRTWTNSQPSAA